MPGGRGVRSRVLVVLSRRLSELSFLRNAAEVWLFFAFF